MLSAFIFIFNQFDLIAEDECGKHVGVSDVFSCMLVLYQRKRTGAHE